MRVGAVEWHKGSIHILRAFWCNPCAFHAKPYLMLAEDVLRYEKQSLNALLMECRLHKQYMQVEQVFQA